MISIIHLVPPSKDTVELIIEKDVGGKAENKTWIKSAQECDWTI